jgi:hypothetical protein
MDQRDWTPPAGQSISHDASWDSTPNDVLKLMQALRGTSLLKHPERLLQQYKFLYQNNGTERYSGPCYVAPGFDPISVPSVESPAPIFWTKSGGYTNQAQSRIFRLNDPPVDVVLHTSTDTDSNPITGRGDSMSLNTQNIFMDTYYLLYK